MRALLAVRRAAGEPREEHHATSGGRTPFESWCIHMGMRSNKKDVRDTHPVLRMDRPIFSVICHPLPCYPIIQRPDPLIV